MKLVAANEHKTELIEKIIAAVKEKLEVSGSDLNLRIFLKHYLRGASEEYLRSLGVSLLTTLVAHTWMMFTKHQESKRSIQATFHKLPNHMHHRLFLDIVDQDRPYLIDTINIVLKSWGMKTEMNIHPVIGCLIDDAGNLNKVIDEVDFKEGDPKGISFVSVTTFQIKTNISKDSVEHFKKDVENALTRLNNMYLDQGEIKARLENLSHQIQRHQDQLTCLGEECMIPLFTSLEMVETKSFLDWLDDQKFVFLGSRYYSTKSGDGNKKIVCLNHEKNISDLGLFKDKVFSESDDLVPAFTRASMEATNRSQRDFPLLTLMKTNRRSPIYRPSRIDSIEILDSNDDGEIKGLYQFIGVFTQEVFSQPAFSVPIVERKAKAVFDRFGYSPQWHDGKILISIIDSIPRDELFHIDEDSLFDMTEKVMQLKDYGRLKVFIRPDIYGRYATVMIYLVREHYSAELKDKFGSFLSQYMDATIASSNAHLGDFPFARMIFIMTFSKAQKIKVDISRLEQKLTQLSLSWADRLEQLFVEKYNEDVAMSYILNYQKGFPASYKEHFSTEIAERDINLIEDVHASGFIAVSIDKPQGGQIVDLKVFCSKEPIPLSVLLPIWQNFGLKIITETPYLITRGHDEFWIHAFAAEFPCGVDPVEKAEALRESFYKIWTKDKENDTLNTLVLSTKANWREVSLIRAYTKYLRQIQLPYSASFINDTLSQYPEIISKIVDIFNVRFMPKPIKDRELQEKALEKEIHEMFQSVARLDHDTILRRLLNAVQSSIRTNFFQTNNDGSFKSYISIKLNSRVIKNLPEPRPMFEVFVFSARMEAIHLRGGKVARGGIRWSDRAEDVRTEILGLMKAQMIKNAVIVPMGSKGGFIVKHQGQIQDRASLLEEVVDGYKTFMAGILDITDNLVNGKVVPPKQVVRYDDDDPYLVVAADKGTATFSDIANRIAQSYNFWLGDAFASGGSNGYDHKKMAITARGAWESVSRHFREIGIDTQKDHFNAVGIGDMSGDVFGNGMLRSDTMRLLAAFNHMHIFIDPDPDAKKSFEERKRLFNAQRGGWDQYNKDLISRGGGVFERSAKSIKLTPEMKILFNMEENELTPDEVIRSILKSHVDLIWFGGIGTYVRGQHESHTDVGDRANDAVRVYGKELNCRVVGEGANLGFTQLGRVEYAIQGGRINTDAIDNSAGVDCSDHEVNIKILFSVLEEHGKITRDQRNSMLVAMTDNVADLVLRDNYLQTQIISLMEKTAAEDLNSFQTLIRSLENSVGLNRKVEFLPDEEELERRHVQHLGLTRPELSVLMGYSKIDLYQKLLKSDLVDDDSFTDQLIEYFPDLMQKSYGEDIKTHPLHREIIATVLTNEIINRVGPLFIQQQCDFNGMDAVHMVRAFFDAVRVLDLREVWQEIEALDAMMIADVQIKSLQTINIMVSQILSWFIGRGAETAHFANIDSIIKDARIAACHYLETSDNPYYYARQAFFKENNLPQSLMQKLIGITFLPPIINIADLYVALNRPVKEIVGPYFAIREKFGFDVLHNLAEKIPTETAWQKASQSHMINELISMQYKLTRRAYEHSPKKSIDTWMNEIEPKVAMIQQLLGPLRISGTTDLSFLGYMLQHIGQTVENI